MRSISADRIVDVAFRLASESALRTSGAGYRIALFPGFHTASLARKRSESVPKPFGKRRPFLVAEQRVHLVGECDDGDSIRMDHSRQQVLDRFDNNAHRFPGTCLHLL